MVLAGRTWVKGQGFSEAVLIGCVEEVVLIWCVEEEEEEEEVLLTAYNK